MADERDADMVLTKRNEEETDVLGEFYKMRIYQQMKRFTEGSEIIVYKNNHSVVCAFAILHC